MEEDAVVDDIDGCIKSIHVKNFFCHDNLEVNFNRNVNFIIGRNGSGKSAILTALVVGLGGRASSTNRGNNLHSFIKKGANSASIEIKIKNHTSYAYKPEVYGDCITVIRNLTASGGSNYKIKASNGEVKSTKFEDVVKITTALDIQVDNPISVLNQDDARSFHASDGKKKYALFRRATNMAQTEVNYNIALENCKTATNIWQKKSDACAVQEKEYKKLRTIYEHLQTRDDVKAKKVALQNEFYWSEIANLEKDVAHQQAIYDKHNERIEKLMDKLSRMEQDFGTNNSTIDNLKKELSAKKGEKTVLEAELVKLEGEVRDKQATWRNEQTKHARASDAAKRERRKIADFEAEIQSIDSGNAATRREALEARSAEAAAAASAAEARYNTAQHHNEQARANAQRAQAQADQADARVRRQRDQIKQLKQQSRELSSRSDDSLAVFGTQMVELVKRVRSAASRGQFSAPPRGPIGSAEYLKVKDSKWGGALEHILGGSMRAFCVNTPEDSRKLFEIMNQVYGSSPKPSVTCSKFLPKKHDVRRNKVVADGFVCALDSLDVSDPVVANYLIDNLNMESILLVPSHDDAIRLSDKRENVPPRCSKIVTLDSSEYYPAPNYRSYGGAGRPARLLHTSVDQRRRQVEAEIKEAEATLASLESRAEAERAESQTAHNEERTAARALQALMGERHEAQEAAKAAAAALETEHTPHLAVLVDELNLSKEKMKSLQAQLDEYSAKEREHREAIDAYDVRMRKIKTKVGQATTTCRNLSEEIDNEQLRQDQSVTEKQSCQRKAEEERVKLAAVQRALEEKRKATAEKTEEALQLCERVRNPRDLTIVQEEIKKMNAKLNSIMSEGMTKEEVLEKLSAVGEKYQRTKQTLDKLNKLIADVKNSIDKHRSYCKKLQHYIQKRVQHNFQIMLSLRNFCGSMEIDNKVGQLEIRCTGREVSRAAASTASLSGGERSYSTVAFIMALWRCVELPFYFMDEFDVFMDNVNRSSVMKLLIDHALNNRSRQFVFLTPQDTSAVSAGPYLKIHKMNIINIESLPRGMPLEKALHTRKSRAWDPANPSPAPGAVVYEPLLEAQEEAEEPEEEIAMSPAFPPSPALFLECGGSVGTSPARSPVAHRSPRLKPRRPLRDIDIEEHLNYGSESGCSDSEEEDLTPMLVSRVYQGVMDTPLDEDDEVILPAAPPMNEDDEVELPAAPPVNVPPTVALAIDLEGAVRPNDFFSFEWRQFPDPPIPPNERREPFSQAAVGPTEPSQDPYTIFVSIWDAEIMGQIVSETNRYAQDIVLQRLHHYSLGHRSRICNWKDMCIDELYTYFAILLAMGIVVKTKIEEYWTINSNSEIFSTPGFHAHMSLSRFQLLNACLHFNNNGDMRGRELSSAEAKLFKIEPIITHLNAKFQSMYTMDRNIALDESLMQWKGWLSINQFITNKAAKVGVKTYELCESQTGYLWRFDVHAKKYTPQNQPTPLDASTPTIVLDLLRGLEGKGYTVWMDNFYNSPALARMLKVLGFDVVGTLRTNRQFVPQQLMDLTKSNMQKGQITGFTSGDVDLMVWRDENRVATISTYHGNQTGVCDGRVKPNLILDYNIMMGGVDKKDQLLSMYPIERKRTKVWYKKLFRRLINISVLNSFIICKKSGSSVPHRNFRKTLIRSLLSRHSTPKRLPPLVDTTTAFLAKTHYLKEHPIGSNKSRLRRRCCVCKQLTHFYCAGCEKAVCILFCFVNLHS